MKTITAEFAKYIMVFAMALFTYYGFSVFGYQSQRKRQRVLFGQNLLMFVIHAVSYAVLYLFQEDIKILWIYGAQVIFLFTILLLSGIIYPKVSRLVLNNMCMLLTMGFIMITRLDFSKGLKQFVIVAAAMCMSLFVPVLIQKATFLPKLRLVYGIVGMVLLGTVLIIGRRSGGALLSFTVKGISVQPSELVKLLFVFFVAASLYHSKKFRDIVKTTVIAAIHVLILVISKDLGAAVIIFVVYLVMLYVATKQPLYALAGIGSGVVASVAAYYLFSHVRNRVLAWKDPIGNYDTSGYQISQSLFAIGTGGWFGMGFCLGSPSSIPVADEDFIFSAIVEEFGIIFGLCLMLICISCYMMFLNIAMELHHTFYKLVALGLGTCYMFQTFLHIGGVIKFIPSTGVTLPLVSYGGSSALSTLIMFAIIQGLYILREDEGEAIEKSRERKQK